MIKLVAFVLAIFCICSHLYSKEANVFETKACEAKASMKKAQKEAQELGVLELEKKQKKQLKENSDSLFSQDDFLPEANKGHFFDVAQLEGQLNDTQIATDSEFKQFLQTSLKREKFEGTEEVFFQGRAVVENPQKALSVVSIQTQEIPAEEKLETCQESGSYQVSFNQRRKIEVIPAITAQVKHCLGHQDETDKSFWKDDAKRKAKRKKKELSKDENIASYEDYLKKGSLFKDYVYVIEWKHKDNVSCCDNYSVEETVVKPSSEQERWETDFPEALFAMEKNPNCKLLYAKVLEGPETRIIQGKSVAREIWSQTLFFSCEPNPESRCAKLREQKGVLIGKKCLKQNDFGECDLWEKTYEMGKRAAYQKTNATFEDQEIWGLYDEFDSSYEKNKDLGSAVTTLSIFSDIKSELEESSENFKEDDAEVFKGKDFKCKRSFLQGQVFDCCKKMEGLAVQAKLTKCNSEEKWLAQTRYEGKCVYVGSQKMMLGAETSQVYCCFPTKLSRLVQEQGREQLGIEWGNGDKPKCRGLSLKELQSIDFSKLDLSEVAEDLALDKAEILKKVQSTLQNLQAENSKQLQQKTENNLQKEFEAIHLRGGPHEILP